MASVSSHHAMLAATVTMVAMVMSSLSPLVEGQIVNESLIEDIRLVDYDGTIDGNQGRVEIKYNGQWGTICSSSWYTSEARVACRMLGFEDALCGVDSGYFGHASYLTPTLMNEVNCDGDESALDFCYFGGWDAPYSYSFCNSYFDDVGVVCLDEISTEEIGTPTDIRLIESSTTSLTIGWIVPAVPSWANARRFTIRYQSDQQSYARTQTYYNSSFINATDFEMSYTLTSLTRDTQYSIQIRIDVQSSACHYYYYTSGNYSDPISFQTNATRRQSNIPVRLISPSPGLHFLGRVEVFYNDQWGTVCDDLFYAAEANVICYMLNFTQGAVCSVGGALFGQGQGPIWLDNVNCRPGDEVLEDCNSNPWGYTSCSHREDVGVVCRQDTDEGHSPAVQNLTVLSVGPTLINVVWSQYTFPPGVYYTGYELQYTDSNGYTRSSSLYSYYGSSSATQYTLRRLQLGEEYSISVRAFFQFSGCYYNIYGAYSNNLTVTTMETAPTASPRDFYVVAINRTAIEAEWDLPPTDNHGGVILGYKLFIQSTNDVGGEQTVDIMDNSTVYVVGGLQPDSAYTLSVLAYTSVGDGPRSIHLTVSTLRFDPLITQFGYYGNGQDRITGYVSSYSYYYFYGRVHVHCASSNFTAAQPQWLFANGSTIGVRDRNLQVGHFPSNGTAVLKIADYRPLSYCDGGIFICHVHNDVSGHSQEKNFTLTINNAPPSPDRPFLIKAQSTNIIIGWSETPCNGGHAVNSFNIRYRRTYSSTYSSYTYIRGIDPALRNYTIIGLSTDTYYSFSVAAVNLAARSSPYSSTLSATTFPPAPTSPRDVTARLVAPLKVEVRWRSPAVTNGDISHYYVYAIPLSSAVSDTTPQTLQMSLPGGARASNITLVLHSVTYQFRVSAAVSVGQTFNEGDLSPVGDNTSLFVPKPGLPMPSNPAIVSSTNSSITLMWNSPSRTIERFLVSYSGEVEWRSSKGFLVRSIDSGETNVTTNSVEISALVPGTTYTFKVSAITRSGRGAEAMLTGTTSGDVSLTYFQLRMGPVRSCFDFMETDDLVEVRNGLVQEFSHLCPRCGVTVANIKDDEFSCRGGLTDYIVYRARIVGTDTYSAPGLVSLMQSWVGSGRASIMVQSSRLHLDPTCDIQLDSLYDTDCLHNPTKPPTAAPVNSRGVSSGEIGGILVGLVIILLLLVLVVVIILKKWRPKVIRRYGRRRTGKAKDETMYDNDMPFTDDIDESNDEKRASVSIKQ